MASSGGGVVQLSNKLKLYSSWISSCSGRVRIALNLKGLDYDYIAVNLIKGEHSSPEFLKLNPMGYVPVLVDGDTVVSDSFAILMYLEEKYPQFPLLPQDLKKKAINYQAASILASTIQPLQMVGQKYVDQIINPDKDQTWFQYHIGRGFAASETIPSVSALEKLINDHAGIYATGDKILLADVFLAPQIHAAINRFNVDMTQFPLLLRLHGAYSELPAFQNAMPENQPDAPSFSST